MGIAGNFGTAAAAFGTTGLCFGAAGVLFNEGVHGFKEDEAGRQRQSTGSNVVEIAGAAGAAAFGVVMLAICSRPSVPARTVVDNFWTAGAIAGTLAGGGLTAATWGTAD